MFILLVRILAAINMVFQTVKAYPEGPKEAFDDISRNMAAQGILMSINICSVARKVPASYYILVWLR